MRLTTKLNAQHLGWMFKKHWQVQGKRVVYDTGAAAELEKLGFIIKDPQEVLNSKVKPQPIEILAFKPKTLEDETNPNWHRKPCHIFQDQNVLLEGLPQAQVLTKSLEINRFPKNIEEFLDRMQLPNTVDRNVQNCAMASHIFDAEQVKLPVVKSKRPNFNLPRIYGISHQRRIRLLINKLNFECEKLSGHSITSRRKIFSDGKFAVTLAKDDNLLQFAIKAEQMMTSLRPIEPVKEAFEGELPDIYPMNCTITIPKSNIYTTKTIYPLSSGQTCSNPHTIYLNFDKEIVGHLYGGSVNLKQFEGRTMIKAFAVAAARAKVVYGEDAATTKLPKPIVVQSIQTDGRTFHFGVFQLNTLSLNSTTDGVNNYWFHKPSIDLFTECDYKDGKPYLEGYNKEVFRIFNAFYNNF